MANGCDYWMVFLPARCPDSFLVFVKDAQDRTSLRNFSTGYASRLPASLTLQEMSRQTADGTTRFHLDSTEIRPKDDVSHWQQLTFRLNASLPRIADKPAYSASPSTAPSSSQHRRAASQHTNGRALRGSQRQLQDYVNLHESTLTAAVLAALSEPLQNADIEWISPRAEENYSEYQDYAFLEAVGLHSFARQLRSFWPPSGPCWDALAILRPANPNSLPFAVLVEAKSHIPEVRGGGCQANPQSLSRIQRALEEAKCWCGADPGADWTGPLYQSANRIAHLYFIRHKLNRPCLLVNLYFFGDPYRPTSLEQWQFAVKVSKSELGLTQPIPGLIDIFLPALEVSENTSAIQAAAIGETFAAWRDRWSALADFESGSLLDAESRIEKLMALWSLPVPGKWQRGIDPQLLADRYRRKDRLAPHPGEHTIEHRILETHFADVRCLGMQLIDGVNAFPLSCDFAGGGRRANVEADMLLLGRVGDQFRLFVCEVKDEANNPWYAGVEALRQLKLFLESASARNTMVLRGSLPAEAAHPPVTALVLAPRAYFSANGKKGKALALVQMLFREFNNTHQTDLKLAVWDESRRIIEEFV